jgi:hypothetical protein
MHQNINAECKEDIYFGDEVKILCNKEKKTTLELSNSRNLLTEEIASYKAVVLLLPPQTPNAGSANWIYLKMVMNVGWQSPSITICFSAGL